MFWKWQSQDLSSGWLAPNPCALSAVLRCVPPPMGIVQGCAPVSKLYCAPQQLFVEYTFEKTQNTEAIVAPKPGLGEKELHPLWG